MTTENLALFKALGAKMDYLNMRQRIIAQNISNADTPKYKPQDLLPVDFGKVLKDVTAQGTQSVSLETTKPNHMPPPNDIPEAQERKQKEVYEVAPVGNAVIMEEQLINSNQTIADYNLMTSLYQKNVGLIRTALGVR
ncbi:MAG TPA: flagellar basal body rod protein FlgB [Rhodospirillaceae bacterium]|nr:flagellar basal body rod protein FlgB [Rhodospirillaceae bacterium]